MASRSISAILWTLVSVNFLSLIVGGLITWLGYTIPVRLKQVGLLPELVIVAGSASLVVACMGLCALNYSSANALNIYACSCALFILMLVLGIPESWYKSSQFVRGTLLLDIIYFSLLFVLLLLFVFAITLAQYMRKNQNGFLQPQPQQQRSSYSHLSAFPALGPAATSGAGFLPHETSNGFGQSRLLGQAPFPLLQPNSRLQQQQQCTCNRVMITPHGDGCNDDSYDNTNQNNNNNNNNNSSIIDRWFARLKPSPSPPAAQFQLQLQHSAANPTTSGADPERGDDQYRDWRPSNAELIEERRSPPRYLPQQQQQQQLRRPASCSCHEIVTPTSWQLLAGRNLPPLISRGIYTRDDRIDSAGEDDHDHDEQRPADCRSTGDLCEQREEAALSSQDDISIKYSEDCWPQPNNSAAAAAAAADEQAASASRSFGGRRSNANYRNGCCAGSSMSHRRHERPMINSSSSVYSISGTNCARLASGGGQEKRHSSSCHKQQQQHAKTASSSGRFSCSTTATA